MDQRHDAQLARIANDFAKGRNHGTKEGEQFHHFRRELQNRRPDAGENFVHHRHMHDALGWRAIEFRDLVDQDAMFVPHTFEARPQPQRTELRHGAIEDEGAAGVEPGNGAEIEHRFTQAGCPLGQTAQIAIDRRHKGNRPVTLSLEPQDVLLGLERK